MPSPLSTVRALLLVLCATVSLHATSVIAPSFPELVAEAQTIVRAKVTAVESRWVASPQGRVIKTYVTFDVVRALKGAATPTLTLEFLGGEVGGEGMRIQGMPRFAVGDVDILFVAGNGVRFNPFVGMMHGRYRVQVDPGTGREFVARNDRLPLTSVDDVQLPHESLAVRPMRSPAAALSPAAFETRITNEISRRAALP